MAIAIIPARGGSQRIPFKNINGFPNPDDPPIILRSINAALESGAFERVVVSSDSEKILQIAADAGATPHARDPRYARNEVGTNEVVAHVLKTLGPALPRFPVCCIYPCAPFITADMLREAHQSLLSWVCHFVVPMGHWCEDPGMFYFGTRLAFEYELPLIGPHTRLMKIEGWRAIDINTPQDWEEARGRCRMMTA